MKMKFKNRKLISVLVSLMMIAGMSTPVFAGEAGEDTTFSSDVQEIESLVNSPEDGVEIDGYIVVIKDEYVDDQIIEDAPTEPILDSMFIVDEPVEALEFAEPEQIESIEPNYVYSLMAFNTDGISNDPTFPAQWNLSETKGIKIKSSWNAGLNGRGARVAVIDSGVNADHRDWSAGTISDGYNFSGTNGAQLNSPPYDGIGHGTMVASIIAANTNNGWDISGIAYGAEIIPIKVFDDAGNGTTANLLSALRKLNTLDVDVVNLSLGTEGDDQLIQNEIDQLTARGVIVVASVGNGIDLPGGNKDYTSLLYPAASRNVIGVSSIDITGTRSSFSQYNTSVDIAAPGRDIYVLPGYSNIGSVLGEGTSFAGPHVAALAAIAKGHNPSITPAAFLEILTDTADVAADQAQNPLYYGAGIMNAKAFVEVLLGQNEDNDIDDNEDEDGNVDQDQDDDENTDIDEDDDENEDESLGFTEVLKNGRWYLYDSNNIRKDGWHTFSDGRKAYFDGDNGRVHGEKYMGGYWYYFLPLNGAMQTGWVMFDHRQLYYDESGHILFGPQTIDGKEYIFDNYDARLHSGQLLINGYYYYYDGKNGMVKNGEMLVGSDWYYYGFDGKRSAGWYEFDNKRAYFDPATGKRVHGEKYMGGYWYYFLPLNGAMQTGWVMFDHRQLYYDENGHILFGPQTIDGKEYIFDNYDARLHSGQFLVGGYYYYYDGKNGMVKNAEMQVGNDWFYYGADGKRLNGWQDLPDGKRAYYDLASGKMVTGEKYIGEYWYYFDATGAMQTGWVTIGALTYYYDTEGHKLFDNQTIDGKEVILNASTGAVLTGQIAIDGYYYYYDGKNGMVKNGEMKVGNDWFYYGYDGKRLNGWQDLPDGKRAYYDLATGKMVTGAKTIDEYQYYFDATGAMQIGWVTISGLTYYYDADGHKLFGDQVIDGKYVFLNASTGEVFTGQVELDGYYYYYDGRNGMVINDEMQVGDDWFYYGYDGKRLNGWQDLPDGKRAYYDLATGKMVTGAKIIDGYQYYFDATGAMQIGWVTISGLTYYYDAYGHKLFGDQVIDGKAVVLDASTGEVFTGQVEVDGYYYYYDGKNGMVINDEMQVGDDWFYYGYDGKRLNGWQTLLDGKQAYYDPDTGKMVFGAKTINGYEYYFDLTNGAMRTGWVTISGLTYYYDVYGHKLFGDQIINGKVVVLNVSTGEVFTGQVEVDGYYYYYDGKNGMVINDEVQVGDDWFYYGYDGKRLNGWQTLPDGKQAYYDPVTGKMITGAKIIDGHEYYFDLVNGAMQIGWVTIAGSTYYYDVYGHKLFGDQMIDGNDVILDVSTGEVFTGQIMVGSYYYYYDGKNGMVRNSEMQVGDDWYYYGYDGKRLNGWLDLPDGKRAYCDLITGEMAIGEKTIDGYQYYFDPSDGSMQIGWVTINDLTYYYDADGRKMFGNQWIDGKEYSLDASTGAVFTGQILIDGDYYYNDGKNGMVYDFEVKIEGYWYYFGADGKRVTGWIDLPDGKRKFYNSANGIMATGSQILDGYWYYFNPSDGTMQTGWVNFDGRQLYYDEETGQIVASGLKTIDGVDCYFSESDGSVYTGEKTIDGVMYFFNGRDGKLKDTTIIFRGYKYVIDTDGVVTEKTYENGGGNGNYGTSIQRGIDVSEWQGTINWAQVKASGIDFAILRAGWTDWKTSGSRGTYFQYDARFVENMRNAKANGIPVGAYLYIYSRDIEEQRNGLFYFRNYCNQYGLTFDLPVFLDIEDSDYYLPSTNSLGGYNYRTAMAKDGMDLLRSYGYTPGFYTFLNWANNQFDAVDLEAQGNTFWLASFYANNAELSPDTAAWNGRYPGMWQYRSTGSVYGISGNVDMNYLYPQYMRN